MGESEMSQIVDALFDGSVFRPEQTLQLPPNTRVRLTIEEVQPEQAAHRSFFDTAKSLNLEGPADWSENVDKYLYGDRH